MSSTAASFTPNIDNGTVFAINQAGNTVFTGGSFTSVTPVGGSSVGRTYVLGFDATTGALSGFAPVLNGTVYAIWPGPTAGTVYVGGQFSTVNGVKSKGITLLNASTGAIVSGFKPPALDGIVYSIRVAKGQLLISGTFTKADAATRQGMASLNPNTGALTSYAQVQFTGHHNYNGSGANGAVGPKAMDVSPDGTKLMVIGNFKQADGLARDQAAMINLGSTSAAVDPNWATLQYTAACFNWAFDSYVRDVQFAPDGSYYVIVATGGSGTNTDGSRSLCDTAARFESTASGSNVQPTWVDYTGQDSLWSVAVTGTAVYVGGHQRWLNNANGFDYAGAGSVPRPGLAALDPDSGVPFSWNPGRNPRGAGAYSLFASANGVYVGSDTDYIGNFQYLHKKIAYFPLTGGTTVPSKAVASLPANVYLAGQLPNGNTSNVLYRVDAGGPAIGAVDNGPDWVADGSDSDPGAQYRNTGSNSAGWSPGASVNPSVPSTTPSAIFNSERWDPGDANEMHWSFPVAAGTPVEVRLYFANRYGGTSGVGQRVFDVALDGTTVLDHYDIVADVGDQTGTMKAFDITSPGNITIDFTHEVENPLINGIEIVKQGAPPSGSVDDLDYRAMNGTTIGPLTQINGGGVNWGSVRGAFMVGNTMYYGLSSGTFYKTTFDGTTLGASTAVDPYNDPFWSNVDTGSGQTYRGVISPYYSELSSVTGAFYNSGNLYYTLSGQSKLFWRNFNPESGIIGDVEFSSSGANMSQVAGMFLSGSTLYWASKTDGALHSVPFSNSTVSTTGDSVVSSPSTDGNDWRSRNLFAYGPPTFPNQLPTASATGGCTGQTCDFDGTNSSDPDGSIASYAWDFGDGTTGTGATPTHHYNQAGTYTVSLVVTDNRGGQSTPSTTTVTAVQSATPLTFVGQASGNTRGTSASLTAPAGISAGDTQLLFVTVADAVTPSQPSGLTGWTQVAQQVSGPMTTTVYRRTAVAGDSGTQVTVTTSASTDIDLQMVDYSGVALNALVLKTAADTATANHTTPSVAVATSGSWVVSFWADRSSGTTSWSIPGSVNVRGTSLGTGGGRDTSVVADSGGPVAGSTYGGLTGVSNSTSGRGVTVSIVLEPTG
ncbi:MAG TPA: PKD domain-containing protein [Jatrophihabitantaceae bacterium]|nr:PKD domain-containing protein [Jatrophihabitantaceae bacterium]